MLLHLSPSASSHFPNHGVGGGGGEVSFLSLRFRFGFPKSKREDPASSLAPHLPFLHLGTSCFSFVECPTIPQIIPSHGAVPLLIPVAPPGVNLCLWLPLVSKTSSRCLRGQHPFLELGASPSLGLPWENNPAQLSGPGLGITSPRKLSCGLPSKPGLEVPPPPPYNDFSYFSTCNAEPKPSPLLIPHSYRAQSPRVPGPVH